MNYEERYKEALERAKKFEEKYSGDYAGYIFPELRESEDERIRKQLIDAIKIGRSNSGISFTEEAASRYIAWLEKQKEPENVSASTMIPSCWSEEDERMIGRIRSVVNECAFYNHALDVNGDYCEGDYAKLDAWLKSLPLNLKKKNEDVAKLCSKEWSEEDEEMINGCIHAIEYELIDNGQDEQVATDPRIAFLKSIRLQPKQEWSEDEIIYWNTIKDYFFGIPLDDKLKSALDWFKSLKPQPKQEWSDTNELVFQDICKHLKEEGCGGWVLFLNALRNGEFQPKQEWSEEDEKMRINILNALTPQLVYSVGKGTSTGTSTYKYDDEIKWLKSLKPADTNNISITPERLKELRDRSFEDGRKAGIAEMAKRMPMPEDTVLFNNGVAEGRRLEREDMWKPTKEQMNSLLNAEGKIRELRFIAIASSLADLYEDLRKLREDKK